MSSILDRVIHFFEEEEWQFEHIVSHQVLRLEIEGDNGEWIAYAKSKEAEQQFVFYSNLPEKVGDDRRIAVAELITRANFGLILGNFEMDFEDGEVHYKTSIEADPELMTPALIRPVVYANVSIMDYYLPSFIDVIRNGVSPLEAIQQLENS